MTLKKKKLCKLQFIVKMLDLRGRIRFLQLHMHLYNAFSQIGLNPS